MWKWIMIMCVIFICNASLASSDRKTKVTVTGGWHGYYDNYYYNYEDEEVDEMEMTLKQKGRNIAGSMDAEVGHSPYSISGKIKGNTITSFKIIPMDTSVGTKEYTGIVDENQSVMDLTNVDDPNDTIRFIKQYDCDKITEK